MDLDRELDYLTEFSAHGDLPSVPFALQVPRSGGSACKRAPRW